MQANLSDDDPNKRRNELLKKMRELRKERNIIAYYSCFLERDKDKIDARIECRDMGWLYDLVHDLNPEKGLDLILHTPGGDIHATEAIGNYLREVFGTNIEVFVPLAAMSGGTMIACAARTIHMGKQSSLGPIDSRIANYVLDTLNNIEKGIWTPRLSKWAFDRLFTQRCITEIRECEQMIAFGKEIAIGWLKTGMFEGEKNRGIKAYHITRQLTDCIKMRSHDKSIGISMAKEIGLKITDMSTHKEIENTVMAIHKELTRAFRGATYLKILVNHNGVDVTSEPRPVPPA